MRCYNVGLVQRAVDREDQNVHYNVDERGCHQGTDAGIQHYNVSAEKVEVAMRCYNVRLVQHAVDQEDQNVHYNVDERGCHRGRTLEYSIITCRQRRTRLR
jgi:hypothetical protein